MGTTAIIKLVSGSARARFEAWFSDGGARPKAVERSGDGYRLMQAQSAWTVWQAALAQHCTDQHPDDIAVDRFAAAMKAKLAKKRAAGRGGWDDPTQCSIHDLARLLVEHIHKGDPVDIANFAMMIHQRGHAFIYLDAHSAQPAAAAPVDQLIYPPVLIPELSKALGFMNFQTGPIAHIFRAAGHDIPTKCEAEQAFVLDRMIRAVIKHGDKWLQAFSTDLKTAQETARARTNAA